MIVTILVGLVLFGLLCVAYYIGHRIAASMGAPPLAVTLFDIALLVVGIFVFLKLTGLWAMVESRI